MSSVKFFLKVLTIVSRSQPFKTTLNFIYNQIFSIVYLLILIKLLIIITIMEIN